MTEKLPPKVVQLLSELEQTLSTSTRGGLGGRGGRGLDELEEFTAIHEPSDEFRFWQDLKSNRRSEFNEMARQVDEHLGDIAEFSDLDSLEFTAVSELLNKTFDALNNTWLVVEGSASYPQLRMVHFFDIIGKALCRYIQKKLRGVDIWNSNTGEARTKLQIAAKICDQWCEMPRKLTTTFWPGSMHTWKGPEHRDTYLEAFQERIEHVLRILTLSDELSQLMTDDERRQYQLDHLFAPLQDQQPLLYNPTLSHSGKERCRNTKNP